MWQIDAIVRENDEPFTIVGGTESDARYHRAGDNFESENAQYLVYIENVGAITLRAVIPKDDSEGGAVEVSHAGYWTYSGHGHCKIHVHTDGSFVLSGGGHEVKGTVIPPKDVRVRGAFQQNFQVIRQSLPLECLAAF